MLAYLVERHGRLVTKAELIDAIWPDAAVTDNSLRRGYVFAAPVRQTPLPFTKRADDVRDERAVVGYPLDGRQPVVICEQCADSDGGPARDRTPPALSWSPGGDCLFVRRDRSTDSLYENGKTYVVPLANRGELVTFKSDSDLASRPGAQIVPHGGLFPGPRPSLYAYTRAATHRNIYRISLP